MRGCSRGGACDHEEAADARVALVWRESRVIAAGASATAGGAGLGGGWLVCVLYSGGDLDEVVLRGPVVLVLPAARARATSEADLPCALVSWDLASHRPSVTSRAGNESSSALVRPRAARPERRGGAVLGKAKRTG